MIDRIAAKYVWAGMVIGQLLFVFAESAFAEPQPPHTIKIGVIAPLSGSAQMYGVAMKNGLELAREELKADNIKVIYEDDRFIITSTVAAFKKLTEIDKVDLVLSAASAPGKAIAPLAELKKVPLLAWGSDEQISLGRKYVIRSYMGGWEDGTMIAKEAQKRGYQRVAEIVTLNDYPVAMEKGFLANFPKERLLIHEQYPPEANDYKAYLTKAKAKNVDAIVMCLNPGQNGILAKQARELGLSAHLCGCENLNNRNEVTTSGNALVGAWFVTVGVTDEFRKKYVSKYGNDDIISGGAVHYDLIYLLHDLLKTWDGKRDLLSLLLQSGKGQGALGEYEIVETPQGGQFLRSHFSVIRITANEFVEEK